ncbi:MAG: GH12 family glycosyl hydrolase domain-containing protein, partial [Nocardioides sp.]
MLRRPLTALIAFIIATAMVPGTAMSATAGYPEICDKYGIAEVSDGENIVQNAEWNADVGQCITPKDGGYTYVSGYHDKTSGGPGSYPSVYEGCHFGNCSSGSELPIKVRDVESLTSSADATLPTSGEWNFSYDVWFDADPRQTGQSTGTELMIWPAHSGGTGPAGSKVADIQIDDVTWQVSIGEIYNNDTSWKIISYVRAEPSSSADLDLMPFLADAQRRGQVDPSHYIISAMAGMEIWKGEPIGSGVSNFEFDAQ